MVSSQTRVWRLVALLTAVVATLSCSDGEAVTNLEDEGGEGGDIRGSVISGGIQRTFVLHVPPAPGFDEPAPLLIAFHGTAMTGAGFQQLTVFERFSDQKGFLVAYIDGIGGGWSIGCDCTLPDQLGIDDVELVETLIDDLSKSFAIDLSRVYVAGFSQGGSFAQIAACALSERLAAAASVGATMTPRLAGSCQPTNPMPIVFIHGTDDPIVPFDGVDGAFLSAAATFDRWAEINGCDAEIEESLEPDKANDNTRVRTQTHVSCSQGAEVKLFTVEGGGHTWPAGEAPLGTNFGEVSQDISGSQVIVEFFARHAR